MRPLGVRPLRLSLALSVPALAALAALAACGSSSSTAPSGNGGDGGSAAVSFRGQVLPILEKRCGTSVCHGAPGDTMALNLYLGDADDVTDATANQVYANLVGVKAVIDPSMNLVSPGDATQSFVLYKLENTQDALAADCAKATTTCVDCDANEACGTAMLYLGDVFSLGFPDEFATIEGWITQGAKNN